MEAPCVAAPLPDSWVVGHGLLGSALADALRKSGTRVLTLDATAPADVMGDAAEPAVLQRALSLLVPEVVFFCQATGGGTAQAYRHAYGDVVNQLTARVPTARSVFCSSVSVYGAVCGIADEETLPITPSERAQVLLATESVLHKCGGVVLRLAALYGPDRCEVLRRHLAGEPRLPGGDDRLLSYLHVDDAVAALLLAARDAEPGSCLNVSGESIRWDSLYEQLASVTGVMPAAEISAASRRGLSDRYIDCTRLRKLGWEPQMNLRRFAEQFAENFVTDAT